MKFFRWSDLPRDTSFFAVIDEKPALAVSLILTNSKIAWLEAFVGNPDADKEKRRAATKELLKYLESIASGFGATKIICMGPCPALTSYYEGLGFKKTATVDTLLKEIC